jgi:CheY-like chemotaxis protein
VSKWIFTVDDSKIVRQLVRTCLENRLESIVCSEEVDGLDAIQRVKEIEPDIILLDHSIPMMNGLEAAPVLHDMMPKVPIIFFTLHNDIVSDKRANAVGIRAVVSKTDQIDVLLAEVQKSVGDGRTAPA